MAKKSETTTTASGAQITTVGGTKVSRSAVSECHKMSVAVAEQIGLQDGVRVEVHLGTNMTRCSTRRNGVHYERNHFDAETMETYTVHYIGINHNLYFGQASHGFKVSGMETLAHEMIHVDQFSSGRCKRQTEVVYRYGTYQSVYTFSGAWAGNKGARDYDGEKVYRPRSPTYQTYRNFPWEQEAFECQAQVARAAKYQVYDAPFETPSPTPTPAPIVVVAPAGKFCCPHCGKGYGSRQGRYKHIKANHE